MKSRLARPDGRRVSLLASATLGLSLAIAGLIPARAQQTPAAKGLAGLSRPGAPGSSHVQVRAQSLATRRAWAIYEIARLTRELAEIAVEEYSNGPYASELASIEGEIELARSNLRQAEKNLARAQRVTEKGLLVMTNETALASRRPSQHWSRPSRRSRCW